MNVPNVAFATKFPKDEQGVVTIGKLHFVEMDVNYEQAMNVAMRIGRRPPITDDFVGPTTPDKLRLAGFLEMIKTPIWLGEAGSIQVRSDSMGEVLFKDFPDPLGINSVTIMRRCAVYTPMPLGDHISISEEVPAAENITHWAAYADTNLGKILGMIRGSH